MAALGHLGVGLAAKRVAPKYQLGIWCSAHMRSTFCGLLFTSRESNNTEAKLHLSDGVDA